jgi:tyrosinase
MKNRPITDPTSWKFQAAIHGFTLNTNQQAGVFWTQWTQGQALPSDPDQSTFWAQCQHGTWYFLPWHRMYLGYFEKIVAKTIADLGGPANWALPYWNYNQGVPSGKLPDAFTQPQMPDGTPNPLLEPLRDNGNDGNPFLPDSDVNLAPAFQEHQFSGNGLGGSTGFGGPVTNFRHSGGAHGALESQPHDLVHVDVGGLMGDPGTAGYDPIFYLHHANIDRLWQVWLNADPTNQNPDANSKWQSFAFKFNDGLGNTPSLAPRDVLDSKGAPFYYQYDDISLPDSAAVAPAGIVPEAIAPMGEEPLPEMVGASAEPIPLTSEPKTLGVRLFPMSSPLRLLGATGAHFHKAYLHVENIRGKGRPGNYDVYLNIPEGAGEPPEKFHIGTIAPFGLEHASIPTERHPGNGLRFTFNITAAVNRLKTENLWNPELLRVTFVPRRRLAQGESLEVGRISLYYT